LPDNFQDMSSASPPGAEARRSAASSAPPAISIIIPVLNEAGVLAATLAGLPAGPDLEVIVVDGGSRDASRSVAAACPQVRLLRSPRGRGRQMNTGAAAARGQILVFLHADTRLDQRHLEALQRAASDPAFKAGAFWLSLAPPSPALKFIARGANLRARFLGLPYGDQALCLRRELFAALGGFAHRRPEDLDLVIRLRRHTRLRLLAPPVVSSGRRWQREGYFTPTLKNCLSLARHLAERTFTRRWPPRGALEAEVVGGGG
jgi:rSAM/selenodomain-associated transferase 2